MRRENKAISEQIKKLEEELAKLKEITNKPKDLFNIIENYTDVCEELDEEEFTLSDFEFMEEEYREKALNQAKIQQIEKLFNGIWKKDWKDSNQRKWYPYYNISGGGLVFGRSGYDFSGAAGQVGFYKDEETSTFIGKKFIDIYQKLV